MVVISSYLPEIINLSDRILVSQKGRIVEEFSPGNVTEQKIMVSPEIPKSLTWLARMNATSSNR